MSKYLDFNGLRTFKNYLDKHIKKEIITPESEINEAVLKAVNDSLEKSDDSEKSELYSKIESIVDDKLVWITEMPK